MVSGQNRDFEKQKTICLPVASAKGPPRRKTITMPQRKLPREIPAAKQVAANSAYRRRVLRGSDFGVHGITNAVYGFNAALKGDVVDKFLNTHPEVQLRKQCGKEVAADPQRHTKEILDFSESENKHVDMNLFMPISQMFGTLAVLGSFHKEFWGDDDASDAAAIRASLAASGNGLSALAGTGPMNFEGV